MSMNSSRKINESHTDGEPWWSENPISELPVRDNFLSDLAPETWRLGKQDLQAIFVYYYFNGYMSSLETTSFEIKENH